MVFKVKQWEYIKGCWNLSPREMEVVKLVCQDYDNSRIGQMLDISYNTVRAHLGNIFRKVGVNGKAGMILLFLDTLQKAKI